jgi:hypothetical protein
MSDNKLDIAICRAAIAGHPYSDLQKKWFLQALDELKTTRAEAERAENLARYYHGKLSERDVRIAELKKEKLKAKDDGYEKGWNDAKRDQS